VHRAFPGYRPVWRPAQLLTIAVSTNRLATLFFPRGRGDFVKSYAGQDTSLYRVQFVWVLRPLPPWTVCAICVNLWLTRGHLVTGCPRRAILLRAPAWPGLGRRYRNPQHREPARKPRGWCPARDCPGQARSVEKAHGLFARLGRANPPTAKHRPVSRERSLLRWTEPRLSSNL